MRKLAAVAFTLAFATLVLPSSVSALPFSFNDPATGLSASVDFSLAGNTLRATLTNTSTEDVTVPSQVLTAVFFYYDGNAVLTPTSATLESGSAVLFAPSGGSGPDVGGEWVYKTGLLGVLPFGANEGISSTGAGDIFGANDKFFSSNPMNLQGPVSPDGLQYGITSAKDDPGTGNAPVTGNYALIKNAVVFEP